MPQLFGSPVLLPSGDGRLELFILAIDTTFWNLWQPAWSNGWSGWASQGGAAGAWPPAMARNGDGRLKTIIAAGVLEEIQQTAWSNGWSAFAPLGHPPTGAV